MVRKQFGDQVRAEVVSDLMRQSFAEAVSKEQLTPAAGPRIEADCNGSGGRLKYAAVFEVMPEVKVAPFEAIQVQRPAAEVTDADVDAMIESMRRQRPEFAVVERAAQATDRVTVDYDGTLAGMYRSKAAKAAMCPSSSARARCCRSLTLPPRAPAPVRPGRSPSAIPRPTPRRSWPARLPSSR